MDAYDYVKDSDEKECWDDFRDVPLDDGLDVQEYANFLDAIPN